MTCWRRDNDGVLLHKMNSTVDGDFQRYAVGDGAYIRDHFFGPDPRLRQLVEHLSDEELRALPRGGHDYKKLYAAYKAATEQRGAPTVILAKTVKGWALGSDVEGRNATHQIKKMTIDQLKTLRERLFMHDEVPDSAFEGDRPPYFRPAEDSREYQYLMERRRALDGALPRRVVRVRQPLQLPPDDAFSELQAGSNGQEVSTTMAFTRLLRTLARAEGFGPRVVPIIPDEARTFGMDALFREFKIYASQGQLYEPVDSQLLLTYAESKDGQLLEEGITEAGAMSSFTAAGTAYATRGIPMVPFFIFYSMFGFQRVGDLIWAAADARTRGFLLGATAGRTTLLGEGLQHQDGHSHVLASSVPTCQAYDPAFAFEMATIIRDGLHRMYGGAGHEGADESELGEAIFYYLTLYNENYEMPALPEHVDPHQVCEGLYKFEDAPAGDGPTATILFSGTAHLAARGSARRTRGALRRALCALECDVLQGAARGGAVHPTMEPAPPARRAAHAAGHVATGRERRADRRRDRLHEDGARSGSALRSRSARVRRARDRRIRPQRHPRGTTSLFRNRCRPRTGGGARRTGAGRHGRSLCRRRMHQTERDRRRRRRPAHSLTGLVLSRHPASPRAMAASVSARRSVGLNWMNSLPASAAGVCPGGM